MTRTSRLAAATLAALDTPVVEELYVGKTAQRLLIEQGWTPPKGAA